MGRIDNIRVFEDTLRRCREHPMLAAAVDASIQRQYMVAGEEPVESAPARYDRPCRIIVSPRRSLEAAEAYAARPVCVLNFASATRPGGGVAQGASAQEECLCRCSTLYPCLDAADMRDRFYLPHRQARNPLHSDDCIYTPGVIAFKSDTAHPHALPEQSWFRVNIITCAAPNLRPMPGNAMNPEEGAAARITPRQLQALHERRMRRILDIAAQNENDAVILGAFGCGVFRNDPEVVAEAMAAVIADYRYCFDTIEFAVYCADRPARNYHVFHRRLSGI